MYVMLLIIIIYIIFCDVIYSYFCLKSNIVYRNKTDFISPSCVCIQYELTNFVWFKLTKVVCLLFVSNILFYFYKYLISGQSYVLLLFKYVILLL